MKEDNRDLFFADTNKKKQAIDNDFLSFLKNLKISDEDIKCELQLQLLGDWEKLKFKIDYKYKL